MITLVILLTIVILLTLPFIFLTHFVTWKPKGGNLVAFIWVQELVGVAIPQELFYRSVLLSGLVKAINRKPICIIVGSIIYALTFWSNDFSFLEQLCYFAFGIVTGILYGTAFLYSESVMPSILVHSLLDFFIIGFTNILLQF